MPRAPGPDYDSFVIRLWHESGGRLLRAEVEHVQTGAIHSRRGLVPAWILDTIDACRRARPPTRGDDGESGDGTQRDDG